MTAAEVTDTGVNDTGVTKTDVALVEARPRRELIRSALVSFAVAIVPCSIALYVVAARAGTWLGVLEIQLAAIIIAGLMLLRQLSVFVEVRGGVLAGNGIFSGTERVALADIRRVLLITTTTMQAPDPIVQLLVLGDDNRRLFRLRGNFWPDGTLESIAAVLPAKTEIVRSPMALNRFYADYPSSEYWFENKPSLRAMSVIGGCLIAVGVGAFVMQVIGRPS